MDILAFIVYLCFIGIGFIIGRITMAIQVELSKPNGMNNCVNTGNYKDVDAPNSTTNALNSTTDASNSTTDTPYSAKDAQHLNKKKK